MNAASRESKTTAQTTGTQRLAIGNSNRGPIRDRAGSAAGACALTATAAVLLGLLVWPALHDEVFLGGDLLTYNVPVRKFFADCLAAGDSPLWFPLIYCGFNLHAEGQAGLFHPWHQLLYRFAELPTALNLEIVLCFPITLVGSYLWLARRGLSRLASLFGALAIGFAPFPVFHVDHPNMLATLAHVPWLLWSIDILLTSKSRTVAATAALSIALLTASQLLLGHPQSVWFSSLVEALYVLLLLGNWANWWRGLRAIEAKLLAAVMATVQLWPTWELLARSPRMGAESSYFAGGAMHPGQLLALVAPYLFTGQLPTTTPRAGASWNGAFELYLGALAPLAVLWVIVRGRALGPTRRLAWGALALAVTALLLACGRYIPPLYFVTSRLPVVGMFRHAAHYIAVASLALVVVMAVAVDDWLRIGRRERPAPGHRVWLMAALPAACLALLIWAETVQSVIVANVDWRVGSPRVVCGGALLATVITAVAIAAGWGFRFAAVSLVALAAADEAYYSGRLITSLPRKSLDQWTTPLPVALRDLNRRVWQPVPFPNQNVLSLRGGRVPDGYAALTPQTAFVANRQFLTDHPERYALLTSVGWLENQGRWLRLNDILPRARLVAETMAAGDVPVQLLAIDPARVALCERPLTLPPGPRGSARVVAERPGTIEIEVFAPAPRLLVLAESWDVGWQAIANRQPVAIQRIYDDFMGCEVPAGKSRVQFVFAPRSVLLGRRISWCGLLATGSWFALLLLMAVAGVSPNVERSRGTA